MKFKLFKGIEVYLLPLAFGLLLFALSLTPSLSPRSPALQGGLGALVAAIGYLIGRIVQMLWYALEMPLWQNRAARIASWAISLCLLAVLIVCIFSSVRWQNSIRVRVGMEPLDQMQWIPLAGTAIVVFALLFLVGLLVGKLINLLRHRLDRVMPRRTANLLGFIIALLLVFFVTREGLVPAIYNGLDSSFEKAQWLFDDAPDAPSAPRMAGSSASLINWQAMGQPGRNFVLDGPTAEDISALTGRPALDPIRVYVGRAQDEDPRVRAQVALEELKRMNAFDRSVLVVASPTGTGWLDPNAMDTLDYVLDGDVATVAVQYSFLQSPMALIFETETGQVQAAATFQAIYNYWRTLPAESRPRLYMHGLSLGAWSSMYALNIFQTFDDPPQGAFWVGSPFLSSKWQTATRQRNPGSPYVSPVVGDGALVRFMTQFGGLDRATAPWSQTRIVYLQHASDAITFYTPSSLWRRPEWMREPPAPDVSPMMRFIPIVTQFQLALDMMLAANVPPGYGHDFGAPEYLRGWVAMTDPALWTNKDTEALISLCQQSETRGCGS